MSLLTNFQDFASVVKSALDKKVSKTELSNELSSKADITALATKADLINGVVPTSQLPSYVDDVIEGYYYNGVFYSDAGHSVVIDGETGKIYLDLSTEYCYRWSGSTFIQISSAVNPVEIYNKGYTASDLYVMRQYKRIVMTYLGNILLNDFANSSTTTTFYALFLAFPGGVVRRLTIDSSGSVSISDVETYATTSDLALKQAIVNMATTLSASNTKYPTCSAVLNYYNAVPSYLASASYDSGSPRASIELTGFSSNDIMLDAFVNKSSTTAYLKVTAYDANDNSYLVMSRTLATATAPYVGLHITRLSPRTIVSDMTYNANQTQTATSSVTQARFVNNQISSSFGAITKLVLELSTGDSFYGDYYVSGIG